MNDDRHYWLDEPKNIDRLFWLLVVVCAVLAASDFVIHRHCHFSYEAIPDFYCIVGFFAFFLIVLAGRALRKVLQRSEDYYDHD